MQCNDIYAEAVKAIDFNQSLLLILIELYGGGGDGGGGGQKTFQVQSRGITRDVCATNCDDADDDAATATKTNTKPTKTTKNNQKETGRKC